MEQLNQLVFVDPLTGSYNRSYFELQARNEIARAQREEESMALCIADVDNFKAFNSTYGYDAGNQVLVNVAQTLRRGVRPFDTVARWAARSSRCCSPHRWTRSRCARSRRRHSRSP